MATIDTTSRAAVRHAELLVVGYGFVDGDNF